MDFEFDPAKSSSNKVKHGIDFYEVQELFKGAWVEAPALIVTGEERFLAIGMIGQAYWTAVITYRGEKVRIISARRSRDKEIKYYQSA